MRLYWDGQFLEAEACSISLDDAFGQGSGLAEAVRVSRGRILNLKLHVERFQEALKALLLPPYPSRELGKALEATRAINRVRDATLRCRYFPSGKLLIHPLLNVSGPAPKNLKLLTVAQRHYGPESLIGRVKSNGMLPNILARLESEAWADDGLRLTPAGLVAEGVWSNLIAEIRGELVTPPLSEGILEGTTRAEALAAWRRKGRKVVERSLQRADLYAAERLWLCSSRWGLVSVAELDGRRIGG